MSDPAVRSADTAPTHGSGWYVAWRAGARGADVCYWNSRERRWNFQGYRVQVTHYEDRLVKERRGQDAF